MNWSLEELPYLTQWKNTVAKSDGYVTGLEPGTSFHTTAGGNVPRAA